MIDILSVEEQIILALKNISELKTVDSYQGDAEDILQKAVKLPAAYVLYGGAAPESEISRDGRESWRGKIIVSFSIFVVGRNFRGRKEASEDVRSALNLIRQTINGLKYEKATLSWQGENLEAITNTGACLYGQAYEYTDYLIQT